MTDDVLTRLSGALAVAAGLILALAAYLQSLEPVGCIGDGCDGRAMRDTPTTVTLLLDGGGALLVASVLGIGLLLRRRGQLGRLGGLGCGLLVAGAAVLAAGGVFAVLFPGPSEDAMPAFVLPGFAGLVVGLVLLAVSVFRARILPMWSVALVAIGTLLLALVNEQTARELFAIPFCLAWAVAGVLLLRRVAYHAPRLPA
jgi:hypothetical protein